MPSLKVSADSVLPPQDCFDRVAKMFEDDEELKRLDPKFTCDFNKSTLSGSAAGKQFKADLKVNSSGAGSRVDITVELPFHLALAKGLVQKTLEKKLAKVLS